MSTISFDEFMKQGGVANPTELKSVGVNGMPPAQPSNVKDKISALKPNYFQRVGQDVKQEVLKGASEINSTEDRSALSKGVGATAASFRALLAPLAEAPGFKQAGELISKGVNYAGEELSKLYSPEFQKELANMSDEEFNKAVQPLTDLKNLGDISNAILAFKGGQKTVDTVKNVATKTKEAISDFKRPDFGKVGELAKNVGSEIVPTADRIVNEQVTKGLQLTAGDVRNIESSTGNVVGRYMADNNLIGKNLAETTKLLEDHFKTNYDAVRSEVAKVDTTFKPDEIPRFKQALTELKNQVTDVAGQEAKLKEIDGLLKKKNVSLNDVQRTKELIDDLYNLYKNTGDVKEGVAKQGFAQIRSELKTFIENNVKEKTGADISELNNKVSTSKGIMDAAESRATSGLTKSHWKIGDLGIFGAGTMIGSPLFGAALLLGKKIIESPAMKFKIAKYLDQFSDAKKLKIQEELAKGQVPKELEKIVQSAGNKTKIKTTVKSSKNPISKTLPQKVIKSKKPNSQSGMINIGKIIEDMRAKVKPSIKALEEDIKHAKEVLLPKANSTEIRNNIQHFIKEQTKKLENLRKMK